jgi:hypothetical protein
MVGIIIRLYHQGKIIEKELISKGPEPICRYVVREELSEKDLAMLPENARKHFLERPDTRVYFYNCNFNVGDYVYVYLVKDPNKIIPTIYFVKQQDFWCNVLVFYNQI